MKGGRPLRIGIVSASRQNHNGVLAVVRGINDYLGSRAILIGPEHPRALETDGIWLPSRCYSSGDDYFDVLLSDSMTRNKLRETLSTLDIVHLHSGSILNYRVLKVIESMSVRPKVIVHVHTHYLDYNLIRFGKAISTVTTPILTQLYSYQARMADLIIFPSVWAREALGPDMGLSQADSRAVVWSAPVQEFSCSEQDSLITDASHGTLVPGTPYLFFAGRLGKEKYLDRMIHLFGWIRSVIDPRLILVVSGFGDQTPYRKIAIAEGLGDKVFFTGQVSEGAVCSHSKGAIAAISCCRNDTQALGNLRQMLCGLPLIAPEDTVLSDHIRRADGGVVFDGTSRSFLSTREIFELISLLTDDVVRAQKGANARQYVLDNFAAERQYAALDALYASLHAG
jgi:glycosyltransferase involved in cell wall biosynthesis